MNKQFKGKYLIVIVLCILLFVQFAYADRVDYSESKPYIMDLNIVSDESQIDKSDKIILDYSDTDGTYRTIHRFYNWWKPTCQHVGHDEWIQYRIYADGRPPENEGGMICYNQMAESTYDQNNHDWGEWIEIERKLPTQTEDGYVKYERSCKYHKGWWAVLGEHDKDYRTEVLPKLPTETGTTPAPTQTVEPTPTPSATGVPKATPLSGSNVYLHTDSKETPEMFDKVRIKYEDFNRPVRVRVFRGRNGEVSFASWHDDGRGAEEMHNKLELIADFELRNPGEFKDVEINYNNYSYYAVPVY